MHGQVDIIVSYQLVMPGRAVPIIEVNLDALNIRVEGWDEVRCVGRWHIAEVDMTVPVECRYLSVTWDCTTLVDYATYSNCSVTSDDVKYARGVYLSNLQINDKKTEKAC